MPTTLSNFGRTRVLRWGNGLGIRIPLSLARRTGLEEVTTIGLWRDGRRILIEPLPHLPTLEELLDAVTSWSVPGETDWLRHAGDASPTRRT